MKIPIFLCALSLPCISYTASLEQGLRNVSQAVHTFDSTLRMETPKQYTITIGSNFKLTLIQQDITTLPVDAIVNAANEELLRGGGVCGAIFGAADVNNKDLLTPHIQQRYPRGIKTGQAIITPSFNLKNKGIAWIVHAVGPIWKGGTHNEAHNLAQAYTNAIQVAAQEQVNSLAFSFLSSNIFGYPNGPAAEIALDTVLQEAPGKIKHIYFALFDSKTLALFKETLERKIKAHCP
jgi:O-acetyl-ADP-ribose deacetylase